MLGPCTPEWPQTSGKFLSVARQLVLQSLAVSMCSFDIRYIIRSKMICTRSCASTIWRVVFLIKCLCWSVVMYSLAELSWLLTNLWLNTTKNIWPQHMGEGHWIDRCCSHCTDKIQLASLDIWAKYIVRWFIYIVSTCEQYYTSTTVSVSKVNNEII